MHRHPLPASLLLLSLCLGLSGCGLGYYWQAASGHLQVMNKRESVTQVLADPDTPDELSERLRRAIAARDFAYQTLGLPDQGSYRHYADLQRPFVVWNVVATAEFSLQARSWCYPIAGCVSYRGYFDADKAEAVADELRAAGDDVLVGGVRAYSTLGRFDDPILNTFVQLPGYQLAGLIFHELAHQQLYIRDDSAFNESFATAVEREGLLLWLADDPAQACEYALWLSRRAQLSRLLTDSREQLEALYAGAETPEKMRVHKTRILQQLSADYAALRAGWPGPPTFDGWLTGDLNNARLAALATYNEWVPAFRQLLRESQGDWEVFYQRAASLSELPKQEREASLTELDARAPSDPPDAGNCSVQAGYGASPGSPPG